MGSWTLVGFSLEEVRDGVATRLLRDVMSLAVEDLREIGAFSSEVDFEGKCLYFSPCAAKAFASVLAKIPIELCDPPHAETLLCLYGTAECLPLPGQRVGCPTAMGPSTRPPDQIDEVIAERKADPSSTAAGWSSVQNQIAKLLPEIPHEESTPHSVIGEDDAPSKIYLLLRAVVVVSAAAVTMALVTPYLAWFAALVKSR